MVPFMWFMLSLEVLLRKLVGLMKPVTFAHTPPGAISNYVMLPLALALWSAVKHTRSNENQ